jgi:hypothetical protein
MQTSTLVRGKNHALSALLLAGTALMLCSLPAHAQWKWRDARGQVHASDMPPPREVAEKDILQRPNSPNRRPVAQPTVMAASAAAAPVLKPTAETELDKKIKAAEREQAEKAKAEEARLAEARAENCKRARSHMATLESGIRIARTNDKGEREVLDDRQRADEMRRAREIIASDCR